MWATAGGGDRTVLSARLCMPALRNGRGGGGVCVHMGTGEGVIGGRVGRVPWSCRFGSRVLATARSGQPIKTRREDRWEGPAGDSTIIGSALAMQGTRWTNYRHELKIDSFVFFCVTCGLLPLAYA